MVAMVSQLLMHRKNLKGKPTNKKWSSSRSVCGPPSSNFSANLQAAQEKTDGWGDRSDWQVGQDDSAETHRLKIIKIVINKK